MLLLRRTKKLPLHKAYVLLLALAPPLAASLQAQQQIRQGQVDEEAVAEQVAERARPEPLPADAMLLVRPVSLTLEVGHTARLDAKIVTGGVQEVEGHRVVYFSRDRRHVGVDATGKLEAYGPGDFVVIALVPRDRGDEAARAESLLRVEVEVHVPQPPVARVEVVDLPKTLYAGTSLELHTRVLDTTDVARFDVPVTFSSSEPTIAEVDPYGYLLSHRPGTVTLTAQAEDVTGTTRLRIAENPVERLELTVSSHQARTGDVIHLDAVGRDARGHAVADLPIQYSLSGEPVHAIIAPGATASVYPDGAFVAERSGTYTVVATSGEHVAAERIQVTPRHVARPIELVGQGRVRDRHTSDLWVWRGADGGDYAITGTWGAEGHAYIWDVSAPENITLVDAVRVDARTVNDVKVSEDGKIAVISREGASNRKNGLVILDVSDPKNGVRILSRYDDQLRGGVHNVFVYDHHIYAINNGRRFDIINIEDPTQPYRVGMFELDTPGHAIHDVWVVDGVAFTSNWDDGIYAIDVGGGGRGGAPNQPVVLGSYRWPSGWNHAAYPYRSKSTGKFYVFGGDEAFPYGLTGREEGEAPPRAAGWIHVISWDDWENPEEVARYQVPEAGTHNLWIEDDTLYVAYYNGGLRVVDVSGELRGDLYRQGREIGMFLPEDPQGFLPNAPFAWGPQPYAGVIYFSDWNSGLWAVRLGDPNAPPPESGEPQ